MSEPIPVKDATPDQYFEMLCKSMQGLHLVDKSPAEVTRISKEFQMKVTAHIRAKTGHNTLPSYHGNGANPEDKKELYKECIYALMTGDFDKLQGQVATSQAASSEPEPEPAPVSVKEVLKKMRTKEPAPTPRFEIPATTEPEPVEEKPAASETEAALALLAKSLGVSMTKAAVVDEKKLVEIALTAVNGRIIEVKEEITNEVSANVMTMAESSMRQYIDSIKLPPRDVVEIIANGETKDLHGRQHYRFPLLVKAMAAGVNTLMVGPAGSFKTTAAHKAAEALGMEYEALSFGPQTSKADLVGYKDANGAYHDTGFVRRVTQGGVFCGDELDAAHAGVLTIINMPLSNGHVATPRGFDTKHRDFRFVGCCNTYGTGANRQYVGRNQLDAATLDRFFFIDWPVDNGLEAHLAGVEERSTPFDVGSGGIPSPAAWLERVRSVREVINRLAIRHIVSPRATIFGIQLAKAGVGLDHLEAGLIWRGLEQATVDKIQANL